MVVGKGQTRENTLTLPGILYSSTILGHKFVPTYKKEEKGRYQVVVRVQWYERRTRFQNFLRFRPERVSKKFKTMISLSVIL